MSAQDQQRMWAQALKDAETAIERIYDVGPGFSEPQIRLFVSNVLWAHERVAALEARLHIFEEAASMALEILRSADNAGLYGLRRKLDHEHANVDARNVLAAALELHRRALLHQAT